MKSKHNLLTTGEFAKVCGVSKQRVLYYDNIDLLKPAFRDPNGRRYYQIYHHDLFYLIEILKNMGMALKDIKSYLDKRTPDNYLERIRNQRLDILNEIEKLQYAKRLIENQIQWEEDKLETSFDTVTLTKNKRIDICVSEEIKTFTSLEKAMTLKKLLSEMHFAGVNMGSAVGSIVLRDNILKEQFEHHSYYFVPDQPVFSNITIDREQLSGDFLVAYHRGNYKYISETYTKMLDYMTENKLNLGEYAFEKVIYGTLHENNPENYVTEISIHVETE